jgi:hypothetical protein
MITDKQQNSASVILMIKGNLRKKSPYLFGVFAGKEDPTKLIC